MNRPLKWLTSGQTLWRITPMAIWIIAIVVLAAQLTVPVAVAAGVAGAFGGFWLGARLAVTPLRLWVPWAVVLPLQALVLMLASALRGANLTAQILGPEWAYNFSAVVLWFGSSALWVGLFQLSTRRAAPFVVLEAAAIAAVGAAIFAAHREGFIDRPFFLMDPLFARNWTPLPVFLAIGVAVAAILVILMATRNLQRRTATVDIALIMALMLIFYVVFPADQIKNLRDLKSGGANSQRRDRPKDSRFESQDLPNGGGDGMGNAVVAVVLLHDDYTPADNFYYFRQSVFSEYNGVRVVRDSGHHDTDVADDFPADTVSLPIVHPPSLVARPLETTVALVHSHAHPFGLVNADEFDAVNNPDPTMFQRAYKVKSDVITVSMSALLGCKVGSSAWDRETWAHYLAAPTDPRYRQLADVCVAALPAKLRDNPLARAVSVNLWLGHNATYDITNKYDNSADPTGDFLFGDRVGYCVSFAHAACALYRTVGVPARVATGYGVDARFRGQGASLLIRSNNAHAWPEVYLDKIGWIPLDIAPEKSLVKEVDPPDPSEQAMYGELARKKAKPLPDRRPPAEGNAQQLVREGLQWLLRNVLGGGILIVFVGFYAVKAWRRLSPSFCQPRQLPRLAYRAVLDALADRGRVRRFGQSREDFAREQADVCPTLEALTQIHLRSALGRGGAMPRREEMLMLCANAQAELKRNTSAVKRVIALINPFGWWQVK